jgi:hypothetical protein
MMTLLQDPPGWRCRDRLQDEARITQDRVMDTSRMENEPLRMNGGSGRSGQT